MTAPSERTGAAAPFVGLTGAIAAGKSAALDVLAKLGAATLSTDAAAHELLDSAEVRARLVERWGPEVAPDRAVDRDRVGAIVFASGEELRWLEGILHPLVGRRVLEWRAGLGGGVPLAVVEVPLLFESGMDAAFDATLVVTAPERVRTGRAGERGTAAVDERAGRQLSQAEKAKRASFVVANDGSLAELEAELESLWPRLLAVGAVER